MSREPDEQFDEDDRVFAAYGRAMHGAQGLEYWLRTLVTVHRITARELVNPAEIERAVEVLSTATMGTVTKALQQFTSDPQLVDQLATAVKERNRLAHQFFAEWSTVWVGPVTDLLMIEDARRVQSLFEDIVSRLASILSEHLDIIGADPDSYVPGLRRRIDDSLSDVDV